MSLFFVIVFDVLIIVGVIKMLSKQKDKREKDVYQKDVYQNGDYDCEDGSR